MKVIPAIDVMGGKVVRLYRGDPRRKTVYFDDPIKVARQWERQGADMLHVVDLDATLGTGSNGIMLEKIAANTEIPVELAGGLRSKAAATHAARIADRIVIGTMAFADRDTLDDIASQIGRDRIVISVDHKNGQIMVHGWQSGTGVMINDALNDFVESGFSEFLLTDVGRDGTMQGPELKFLDMACSTGANIIASGGISDSDDVRLVRDAGAAGVILGKALYEGKIGIMEAKKWH